MFRFFARLVLLALVVAGLLWAWQVGGQALLERASKEALQRTEVTLSALGVRLRDVSIERTRFEWPLSARWEGVSFSVIAEEESALARRAGFEVEIESARIDPVDLWRGVWGVEAVGLACRSLFVEYLGNGPDIGQLWLSGERFERHVNLDFRELKGDLREEYRSFVELMEAGSLTGHFELEGAFGFRLENEPVSIRIEEEQRGERVGLRANREDVDRLAELYALSLTPAEVEVISKYPLQAPGMLRIQRYAANAAQEAARRDAEVPQDAYRHLLWSYLLSAKFGLELAEEITDAHEVGSTTNTPADHRMDYHNNRLGRKYAVEGRSVGEILSLAKTDPEVIRAPR